jgi:hypothetical protein
MGDQVSGSFGRPGEDAFCLSTRLLGWFGFDWRGKI